MNFQSSISAPSITISMAALASERLWVAWQLEKRDNATTKVPYIAARRRAKANRGPWLTREEAGAIATQLSKTHGAGGIGLEFAGLKDGRALGGIDLDTCLNPQTGKIEEWALKVIEKFSSYTEVSPSGTGVKIFLTYTAADLAQIQTAMGTKWSKSFKRGGENHPPAIEVHLGNRYFCVTEKGLEGSPQEFRHIETATLVDLITVTGPAFAGTAMSSEELNGGGKSETSPRHVTKIDAGNPELLARINAACGASLKLAQRWQGDWTGLKDKSGSGKAFTLIAALKRAGVDFEDTYAALSLHPETQEWAHSKGAGNGRRGFKRAWDRVTVRPHAPAWLQNCQTNQRGEPHGHLVNVMLGLREDEKLRDLLAFDQMLRVSMLQKPVPGSAHPESPEARPLKDADVTAIQEYLQLSGLEKVAKDTVHQALDSRAMECSFHPIQDYLKALQWDAVPRLESWLHTYLGVEPTPYSAAIGKMFLIAMVARIFQPGCKADYLLILEGKQGGKKSTACSILAGQWFSDSLPDVRTGKDVSQHLNGKWLIEVAEMSALEKAEAAAMKAFVTRSEERYRPSYGRKEVVEPRQCVFIGTTNKQTYLRDETGGRRFWPVTAGTINTDALTRDRDMLFAEAVVAFWGGARWWPDGEFEAQHIRTEQEARYESDVWEQAIAEWLAKTGSEKTTVREVANEALGLETWKIRRSDQLRISTALERVGWIRHRSNGIRFWVKKANA